ncbi:MAG: VWA domain-containing protein [Acidobacteria bacterium]|nr:VWA domain-containing protein [Acidobacteriota bacterium]
MSINETSSRLRPATRRREARERGIAVMLTAMMMLFTIPAVGLAIDAGLLYLIRARMTAACDAASLATARNLHLGITLAEQMANATARGQVYFNANFPANYLGVSNPAVTINIVEVNVSTLRVTSTSTGSAPVYFMRILGGNTALAGGSGVAVRRDVNLMLVLDRSGSMAGTPCTDMIAASKTFTNMFINGRDRIGLVTYGGAVYNAYAPTKNFKMSPTVNASIDQITCNGWTNTSGAYWSAYQQLQAVNEPLALNLIVFFTDGVPTAFSAQFPVKTVSDSRHGASGLACGSGSTCTIPKSSCVDDLGRAASDPLWGTFAGKTGVITGGGSGSTGDTPGILNPVATSFSNSDPLIPATQRASCDFGSNSNRARRDLAYIPAQNTVGLNTTGYKSVVLFSSGHPYVNRIRIDKPVNISAVASNLADNAAAAIRADTNLDVVTYTLGLGSVDEILLKRMANDLTSPIYDNTKEHGLYAYAPNSAALNEAFNRIASDILRLTN